MRTAGTNCDIETAYAFKLAGSEVDLVHINKIVRKPELLRKYRIIAIPGGFTYGDDIASGKILANEIKYSLKSELRKFISGGRLVIGICNGFQVLVKMGLLPGVTGERLGDIEATLSLNDSGKFEDRWVYLAKGCSGLHGDICIWTKGLPGLIHIPVAHAEGKFIPRNRSILKKMSENGQIVFKYVDKTGQKAGYPSNPNGSIDNIAGICDPTGRILGMMPHPERHIDFTQNPYWQRDTGKRGKMGIGLKIFENGVNFAGNMI